MRPDERDRPTGDVTPRTPELRGRLLAFGECGTLPELLREAGLEVLRAPGKSRALGLAKDLLPAIVMVGAGKDAVAAIEIVELLAADAVTRLLPVLLICPSHDAELVRRGLDAGASDVLDSDMDKAELLARTRAALRATRFVEGLIAEKQRLTLLELAGAVAHQINQPLTSMSIIVETLIASLARSDLSNDRLMAKLQEMQRLVDRMAFIVKQVAGLVEYRTVDYIGDVKIIDLDQR